MIRVRLARDSDRRLLLVWRNDAETRAASLQHESVTEAEHDIWFSHALVDPDIIVYIGELDDEPVGTVRFDRDQPEEVAEVSINLSPAHRGKGLARPLLQQAVDAVRMDALAGLTLRARIRPENAVSLHLFDRVGFARAGVDEGGVEVYELRATPADPS